MADSGDEEPRPAPTNTDVVIVGGGHNGLVAAAYLARYGTRVTILERLGKIGGAAVSERPFPGVDTNLSRYSYLVSLLPYAIVRDLELKQPGYKRTAAYGHFGRPELDFTWEATDRVKDLLSAAR